MEGFKFEGFEVWRRLKCGGCEVPLVTHTPSAEKGMWEEQKRGGMSVRVCVSCNSRRKVERKGLLGARKRKCACERMYLEDIRLQSIKDFEPTAHQMTFETPFANKQPQHELLCV